MGRTARGALSLLCNLIFAITAVLVGWGLDDVAGFFRNPARMAVIAASFVSFALGTLLEIEFRPLRKESRSGGIAYHRWNVGRADYLGSYHRSAIGAGYSSSLIST
jgi:hypothetical protein